MAALKQLVCTCCGLSCLTLLPGCGGRSGGGGSTIGPTPYVVVFERNTGPGPAASEIYVMNGNGENLTRLTSNSSFDGRPSVSENSVVTFDSARSGTQKIYSMALDGSNQVALSQDNAFDARINRAGTLIVYVGLGASSEIWSMNADGTKPSPDHQRRSRLAKPDLYAGWAANHLSKEG